MKFLFTCGGTAGHINPALAVAGRLRELEPDSEFLFIGAEGRMETDLVPRAGYEIRTVRITNIHRGFSVEDIKHNLATLRNVVTSTGEAKRIIREFRPDAAVGTGGYVCYPVLRAAHELGIPTAVHESNAVPGLTTKMLEGSMDAIMVGFEESRANYKHPERVVVTGTPVRAEFLNADKLAARRELGLPEDKPLVASVWGSLGAGHMNEIMTDFIVRACANPFFGVIHSAGKAGYEKMAAKLEEEKPGYAEHGMAPGESAGNSCENGALSPVAGWGTGSTGPSRRTWHFHLPGKCREFLRKRFTFPSWSVALPVQRGHCFH